MAQDRISAILQDLPARTEHQGIGMGHATEMTGIESMPDLHHFAEASPPPLRVAEGAVLDGGGEYVGIQRGSQHKGIPDMVLFNDPLTRTTLALVLSAMPISAQQVRAKITHSRFVFTGVKLKGDDRRYLTHFAS